jgi:menaquinone-dependent protoporphyrinogen oxidase
MSDRPKMSRRKFLQTAAITAAAGVMVCGGSALITTRTPDISFPESHLSGGSAVSKKILVAYASKAGSTAEIAEAIGKTLSAQGAQVDVLPIKKVTSLAGYQGVAIGSTIRIGRWLSEAVDFVSKHKAELSQVPTAYFLGCLTLKDDTAENRKTADAYLDPLRAIVQPVQVGLFAGKMDMSKLSMLDRWIVTAMKSPVGDFRDWNAINSWAAQLFA